MVYSLPPRGWDKGRGDVKEKRGGRGKRMRVLFWLVAG